VHDKIRRCKERSKVGSGTKGERDAARRKAIGRRLKRPRLSAIVQRDARSVRSGEFSNRLPRAPSTKHHNARPL
jgi:hypothetical protein